MHVVADLEASGLIAPPKWLSTGVAYLTLTGSHSYGCATPESDRDIYGFSVPPGPVVFPWLTGAVPGFGTQPLSFDQFQAAHLAGPDGQEIDLTVYGIVRYFELCRDSNPNMLDSLFTPEDCVLHLNRVGRMVRERRKLFLSRKCLLTYRAYATGQLKKLGAKRPQEGSRRFETVQTFGYDLKYATHLLRLTLQAIQVLSEGDMDLRRDSEILRAVRRGEWTQQEVLSWHEEKDAELGRIAEGTVAVPDRPDEKVIKTLLLDCLEEYYGTVSDQIAAAAVHALKAVA